MFLFPAYPRTTRWLTKEEGLFAEWRLSNEVAGIIDEDSSGIWWGVSKALRDPLTYLFTFMQMMLTTGQSFTYFLPSIIKTLGYNNTITLLLTAPPYAVASLGSVALAYSSKRKELWCAMTAISIRFYLARLNKKIDAARVVMQGAALRANKGHTETMKAFRYKL